jgi:hypothetical protein
LVFAFYGAWRESSTPSGHSCVAALLGVLFCFIFLHKN